MEPRPRGGMGSGTCSNPSGAVLYWGVAQVRGSARPGFQPSHCHPGQVTQSLETQPPYLSIYSMGTMTAGSLLGMNELGIGWTFHK